MYIFDANQVTLPYKWGHLGGSHQVSNSIPFCPSISVTFASSWGGKDGGNQIYEPSQLVDGVQLIGPLPLTSVIWWSSLSHQSVLHYPTNLSTKTHSIEAEFGWSSFSVDYADYWGWNGLLAKRRSWGWVCWYLIETCSVSAWSWALNTWQISQCK